MSRAEGEAKRSARRRSFREGGASVVDDIVFRLRARRILGAFPRQVEAAADLGSGHDFRLLRHLRETGRIVRGVAVDISLDRSRAADQPDLRLLEADLGEPLDIPDRSVDVVLSLAVLEHMERPQVHVAEAHRILRSPGLLLLTSPSRASRPLLEFLAYRLHLIDAEEIRDHRHYFDAREIRELLVDAGFAGDDVRYRPFLLGLNQFVVARKP